MMSTVVVVCELGRHPLDSACDETGCIYTANELDGRVAAKVIVTTRPAAYPAPPAHDTSIRMDVSLPNVTLAVALLPHTDVLTATVGFVPETST